MTDENKNECLCGESDSMVLLLATKDQAHAETAKAKLEKEGIPSVIKSVCACRCRTVSSLGPHSVDYRLFVSEKHEKRAGEIIGTIAVSKELQ